VAQALVAPETQAMLIKILEKLGQAVPRVAMEGEVAMAEKPPEGEAKPPKIKAKRDDQPPVSDDRSMGQLFKDEPLLQKALDMFDGEVLP
jgi:hypothetical protein